MRLGALALAVSGAWTILHGCSIETECPPGAERCACALGWACDPGLECRSEHCVRLPANALAKDAGIGFVHDGSLLLQDAANEPEPDAGAEAASDAPVVQGIANLKFCSEIKIDGADTVLRLTVLDKIFDAFTGTCSPCQQLPAGALLDFDVLKMPESVSLGGFQFALEPGEHVLLGTVENGEGALRIGTGRPGLRCEDLDPF